MASCDDLAVQTCGNPQDYARALATLEEMRRVPPLFAPTISSGSLLKRIRRLLAPPAPDRSAAGWLSGLVTLLVTISLVYCWHQRAHAAAPNQEMASKNGPAGPVIAPSSDALFTRFYDLDWVLLRPQLEKTLGQTSADLAPDELLRQYLDALGVTLKPPQQMRLSAADQWRGFLLLRANRRELDAFEQSLQDNGAAGGTIPAWARTAEIGPMPTATDTNSPLESRLFRVDPNTFISFLANLTGIPNPLDTNPSDIKDNAAVNPIQLTLRRLLAEVCGMSFVDVHPEGNPSPVAPSRFSTAFLNTRTGVMYVRTSQAEMGAVESLLSLMATPPPQVTIEVRFVELLPGAYDQEMSLLPKLHSVIKAELPPALANFGTATSNRLTANGLRSEFVTIIAGRLTHILAPPQYQSLMKRLEHHAETDIMTAPRVTTLSGRQAQISVTTQRAVVQPKDASHPYAATITVPLGPMVDVVPQVTVDGYAIRLTVIPSILMLDGDEAPANNPSGATPHLRLYQAASTVTIWDGQTVVLGEFVPVPSGKAGRQNEAAQRRLLVFVTASTIDPAGNRLHTETDFPFDITQPPVEPKVP